MIHPLDKEKLSSWPQKTKPFRIAYVFGIIVHIAAHYLYPAMNWTGLGIMIMIVSGCAFRVVGFQFVSGVAVPFICYESSSFPALNQIFLEAAVYSLTGVVTTLWFTRYLLTREKYLNVVLLLNKMLNSMDTYTGSHSEQVARYAWMIAKGLNLSRRECERVYVGGLLHDIGKIGIAEAILHKPSKLTSDEYEAIKEHPLIGFDLVKHMRYFEASGVLNAILYHHEKYDGSGYPMRLKGEQIPLIARIVAVADAYDSMTTKRAYRYELDGEHAIRELSEHSGTQFDPRIVRSFAQLLAKH